MIMNEIFLDSNIILYFLDDKDERKQLIALGFLKEKPKICSQVLVEVANVCKRKFGYTKEQLIALWEDLLVDCEINIMTRKTIGKAILLTKKYDFQLFDALIISSALESNCTVLYSEDMQHNLIIDDKLKIINPFI